MGGEFLIPFPSWPGGPVPGTVIWDQAYLTTLLQIVPATVVAVFVFAAATVFVIAQVIHSPLGSRGVEVLLSSRRSRFVLRAGVLLLIASLLFAVFAPGVPRDDAAIRGVPAVLATALAAATALYAGWAVVVIFGLLRDFVQPERYADRLCRPDEQGFLESEDAYRSVRTIRQWLRTACGSGESRDITLALVAMRNLVEWYIRSATGEHRPESEQNELRCLPPQEYKKTRTVVDTHWQDIWTPSPEVANASESHDERGRDKGWFGGEVGRAVVRSLETGIRARTLLVRDADRILGTTFWAIEQLHEDGVGVLCEEVELLIDRVAEIGLFREIAEDGLYQTWCTQGSAEILRNIACKMLDPASAGMPAEMEAEARRRRLRDRAVAGWLLIKYDTYTLQEVPAPPASAGAGSVIPVTCSRSESTTGWRGGWRAWSDIEGRAWGLAVPDRPVTSPTDDESDPVDSDMKEILRLVLQGDAAQPSELGEITQLARRMLDDLSWLAALQRERQKTPRTGAQPKTLEDFIRDMAAELMGGAAQASYARAAGEAGQQSNAAELPTN
ncbi:hypothetical protein [Geodermatophilus sp. URMC 64]